MRALSIMMIVVSILGIPLLACDSDLDPSQDDAVNTRIETADASTPSPAPAPPPNCTVTESPNTQWEQRATKPLRCEGCVAVKGMEIDLVQWCRRKVVLYCAPSPFMMTDDAPCYKSPEGTFFQMSGTAGRLLQWQRCTPEERTRIPSPICP
jgi:hypothetical protein